MTERLDALRGALERATGRRLAPMPAGTGGQASPPRTLRWSSDQGSLFVKVAESARHAAFAAEAAGLAEIGRTGAIRVPAVLATGDDGEHAFIALEWLELAAPSPRAESRLGEGLAMLHRVSSHAFGWNRDNTIGPTPQRNAWTADWPRFFVQQRLGPQLELAQQRGERRELIDEGRRLCEQVHVLFSSYRPVPSLLHGDLWGGNWGADRLERPFVFDPAVYFGDRETDVAMTRLFGGFGPAFYAAYQSAWPLDQAAATRSTLYNLYHVLNHAHLFGGGYSAQALAMIRELGAEIGC
jgi:fructosamine-3-kinase